MARLEKRLEANCAGDFYVDETCIDCATCRWMAPEIFDRAGAKSRVHSQPLSKEQVAGALRAVLACPTGSIGALSKHEFEPVQRSFPYKIDGPVYHSGYHAQSSFGAASYFIKHPEGNVLVDSPRFTKSLVRRFEELGGIDLMFMTHCDDVADHQKFRDHFGCERILHAADIRESTKNIERAIEGRDEIQVRDDLLIIPSPGHTRGSACLIYNKRVLFSGDHVAWSSTMNQVYAFKGACWYDWSELQSSMARLAHYQFEWILPGHGWPCHFPAAQMVKEMHKCINWMKTA
jgi:glyoxylase-like metal-dependent hydrolase (beta-lactamase superfamily II)/ferredoxin